jgi:flagellar hook-associated protein 2
MSLSTNLISGLSSGFDWRSMIDQLIAVEHRRVDIVENRKSDYQAKLSAFRSMNTMLLSLKTQSVTLAKSDSFNVYTSSLTTNSANYTASDFMSITTSADAAPGSHTIEMTTSSSIAQARKISSKSFASYDEALVLTGEFVINGRAVRVDDTDDLMDIRDKINNVNSGSNATGVTASILTVSSTDYRLILTSDNTGKDAFNIFDASADTVNILQNTSTGLGFLDSTTPTIKNPTSDGAESERFSSSEVVVGSLLGLTSAQSGTGITIGGGTVDINLATQSLATIAGNINAVGGVSASVESVTEDGITGYYIDISGTTTFSDKNNVLQTLGILAGGQSKVAEVHLSDTANTAVSNGLAITGSIFFDDITGYTAATGDTITISGTKHDGTAITTTDFNVYDGSYKNVDALLDDIETLFFGELTGTATITDGKIQVTDNAAGDSQLSITLVANNEGWTSGGTLDFGTITASTEGYTMQTAEGKDASVKIDGTTITSSTNVITDVIAGVTINLKKIESGSQVDLNISRNLDSIKSSVQSFIGKYNEILEYINDQFAWDEDTESAGLLSGDGTLSSIKSSLQNILISTIKDLPTDMNALSLIGINSDMNGVLLLDDSDFTDALVNDFAGVRRIFIAEGTTTDGDISYISHTRETVAGDYGVVITTAAEQAAITGGIDLSGGIASDETMVITQGDRTATIALDDTGNGKSIDDIVNAINSELDTVYTELWTGTEANTKVGGGAITSSTVWKDIDTEGGSTNFVTNGDTISFSGKTRSGTSISGTYTIEDKTTDTVQGLLSAIENAYGNNVSANIDSAGKLIVTDNTAGGSQLEISVTCNKEGGGSLTFGAMEVTTEGRYAMAITASKDAGSQLVLESDDYGSSVSFTVSQVAGSDPAAGNEVIIGSEANTKTTVGGSGVITAITEWGKIDTGGDSNDIINGAIISYTGTDHDGTSVSGSYTISDKAVDTVQGLLTDIENTFSLTAGSATVDADGKIQITDSSIGASQIAIEFSYDTNCGDLNLGTFASVNTGMANGSDSGVDVAGTINGEAASGSGQTLTGDAPAEDETTSVEGLSIKVTLTPAQLASQGEDQGNVKITMGAAELFDRELYGITDPYDGYVAFKQTSLQNSIDSFETQIEEMEARLNRKMEVMINRFVAMELSLAKIQNQSDWLTAQIGASYSGWV